MSPKNRDYLKILVNKVKVKSYILSPRSVDNEQTNEVWICRHGISEQYCWLQ